MSGKPSINLSRRVTMPDSSFGGVAVVSLNPDYLPRFYDSIDIGGGDVVSLVGTDGIVRARSVRGGSAKVGESIAVGGKVLEAFAREPSGWFSNVSPLDGIEHIFSYRRPRLAASGAGRARHERNFCGVSGASDDDHPHRQQLDGLSGALDDIRKSAHRIGCLFGQFVANDVAERAAALERSDDATAAFMADSFVELCEAAVTRIANRVRSITGEARAAQ